MKLLPLPITFEWDKGNSDKNWIEHKIKNKEAEELFFDDNKKIFKDKIHSNDEERFIILGKTGSKKLLYLVFTLRQKSVRIISARIMNKKEVTLYEKKT